MVQGRLYDGVTGHPHEVSVAFSAEKSQLSQAGGWAERIEAAQLRRLDASARFSPSRAQGPARVAALASARMRQRSEVAARQGGAIRALDRPVGANPRAGGRRARLLPAVVAIGYVAPHWIAPHVPMSWERNVGGAIVGDFGNLRCRDPKGQQALEALVERVSPGATKGPDGIKIAALDVSMFNAAALPGGYIVVFKPAITETNPDALAGILAHEVAHVHRRHVAEALIRELGIGALIRMMGGNIGANAEQIVSLSYTRQNEAQADADAIRMLRQRASRRGRLRQSSRGWQRAATSSSAAPCSCRAIR